MEMFNSAHFVIEPDLTDEDIIGEFCGTWPSRPAQANRGSQNRISRAYHRMMRYVLRFSDGEPERDDGAVIAHDNVAAQIAARNVTENGTVGSPRQMSPRTMLRVSGVLSNPMAEMDSGSMPIIIEPSRPMRPPQINENEIYPNMIIGTLPVPQQTSQIFEPAQSVLSSSDGVQTNTTNPNYSHFKVTVNKISKSNLRVTVLNFSSYDLIHCGYLGYSVASEEGMYILYTRARFVNGMNLRIVEAARLTLEEIAQNYTYMFPIYVICIENKPRLDQFSSLFLLLANTVIGECRPDLKMISVTI